MMKVYLLKICSAGITVLSLLLAPVTTVGVCRSLSGNGEASALSPQLRVSTIDFPIWFKKNLSLPESLTDNYAYELSRDLRGITREEKIFDFFTHQVKNLIRASGITIYIIEKNQAGDLLYRNIWREGMEGYWQVLWRRLPEEDEKAINVRLATPEEPFLYIRARDQSPFVYAPWLLKDIFMYRFGAESRASKFASRWIDRVCSFTSVPATIGLWAIKMLRPHWLARVNESLHLTVFDKNNEPLAQILINNWETGNPLFISDAQRSEKLETLALLSRQISFGIRYNRQAHYLARRFPYPEEAWQRLEQVKTIYREKISHNVHSSKNHLIMSLPGFARLLLKKIREENPQSPLAEALATHTQMLINQGLDKNLLNLLAQFEERDMKYELTKIQSAQENPESLLGSAAATTTAIVPSHWRMSLISLYTQATTISEARRIHSSAQQILAGDTAGLQEAAALYELAVRAIEPEQQIRIQEKIYALSEKSLATVKRFIDEYKQTYNQTLTTITAIEQLGETPAAAPFKKNFDLFISCAHDYLRINEEFFTSVQKVVDNIDLPQHTLNILPHNVAKLLEPYKFSLEVMDIQRVKETPGVTYSFHYSLPDDLWIMADATELNLIMDNLLSNAIKYSKKGGLIELIARPEKKIVKGALQHMIAITVRDQGRGIDPSKLHLVGTEHERLGADTETTIQGSGIGLSYVKRILKKMGGHLEVASEGKDKGSAFTIYLPAAVPAIPPAAVDSPHTPFEHSPILTRPIPPIRITPPAVLISI